MKINKYPDGSSYVDGIGIGVEGSVFKINNYESLWHLNQAVDAYNNKFKGHKPTIIIPNLLDAQADRRFNHGESSGLKLVCKFLNEMNANFKIFHPHNPEVVEALIDNVEIIDNKEFIANVLLQLYPNAITAEKRCILMSSDAGGFKPLIKVCDKLNWRGETASASKARDYSDGKSKLIQTIPLFDLDKDILIIDDICVYGGTFKGLSKQIKSLGHRGKLHLAVSHITVQNLSEDPITDYFDKVFTTNSKYENYEVGESSNKVEVINLF